MNKNPLFIGADVLMERFAAMAEQAVNIKYPPYNIKKVGDNKYVIEMGVAGFSKNDLEIEILDGKLVVTGRIQSDETEKPTYIWHGLAARPFFRTFDISDTLEVRGADLLNGVLQIVLEQIIPEHKKPKKVPIGGEADSNPEFLQEEKK